MYSVVLLKESIIIEHRNTDDTKFFEESIILLDVKEEYFKNKSEKALLAHFNEQIPPVEYVNGHGESVLNRIIRIIDYVELMDSIEADDYTEVYSRFLIEKIGTTPEDVIIKYYP